MDDDGTRSRELGRRLEEVRGEIDAALRAAGRSDTVDLVVVTKFHPLEDIARLVRLGACDIGENRVQEAADKVARLGAEHPELAEQVRWHMIGQIQSKKTGNVAGWADVVHSVDRAKVAEGLSRGRVRALDEGTLTGERARDLDVLVQLGLDDPGSGRGGAAPEDVRELAGQVAELPGLRLAGLMVVPPLEADPREAFDRAARVRSDLLADHPDAQVFSAGMSADLAAAVEAGSTCVRVGSAILGARPLA